MTLKRYDVRRTGDKSDGSRDGWAIILVDTDVNMIATVSDHGNYAHIFGDPGGDFRSFLVGLEDDPHYLHGKLMFGRPNREVYDDDGTRDAVRERITSYYGAPPEKLLDGDRESIANEFRILDDYAMYEEEDFSEWCARTSLPDPYDLLCRKPEPQCFAFCTAIYPRFVAMLREELADEEPGWGVWATPAVGGDVIWRFTEPRWLLTNGSPAGLEVGTRGSARRAAERHQKIAEHTSRTTFEARKLPPELCVGGIWLAPPGDM